jgi:hypothetical protein
MADATYVKRHMGMSSNYSRIRAAERIIAKEGERSAGALSALGNKAVFKISLIADHSPTC